MTVWVRDGKGTDAVGWRLWLTLAAACVLLGCAPSTAAAQLVRSETRLVVDPASAGRVFEGIGAVSAGASSRLLIDYPEPQRSQILDLLFKPGYGAGFQHFKVEVGGDINSTDGSEPSLLHTRDDSDPNQARRGYEWWLMEEAVKRNPAIVLDCLAWGAPAWVSLPPGIGGPGVVANSSPSAKEFATQDMADYLVKFLTAARDVHHLRIRYVGVWNERAYSVEWIKLLRRTLDQGGFRNVGIAAADQINRWGLADEVAADPELKAAVAALAVHYPQYKSTAAAVASGLPLWSSEDGPWKGTWDGAMRLARMYNRNYVQGRMTKTEIWSPVTSYYDLLPLPGSGVMRANTPWSGAFEVQPALWATAMTTRFVAPGWHYLDSASQMLEGGSVVTLVPPTGNGLTMIAETMEAKAAQGLTVRMPAAIALPLHLWRTTAQQPMVEVAVPATTARELTLELAPGAIYTLTTTTVQTQAVPVSPGPRAFPFPFRSAWQGVRPGGEPAYLADQSGSFELVGADPKRARVLKQMAPRRGVEWDRNPYPETIFGDAAWTNYAVSTRARLDAGSGAASWSASGSASGAADGGRFLSVFGRITKIRQDDAPPIGYWLRVEEGGHWELSVEDEVASGVDGRGRAVVVPRRLLMASGHASFASDGWHRLELTFRGSRIAARLDGKALAQVQDSMIKAGMAGIGCGWHEAEFAEVAVEPLAR